MKSQHQHVKLLDLDSSIVTVSIVDIERMLLSLVNDDSLMVKENISGGYDQHTGRVDSDPKHNQHYGEIHTGDYCGRDGKYMPLSVVVFDDKTHTDLHGTLSLTPIIFTLTCFNLKARNNPNIWRPLAYILY